MHAAGHDINEELSTTGPSSRAGWMLAGTVYVATAIVYLAIPIWPSFGESLLGTSEFGPDNLLNAGILEWGYKAAWSSSLRLFDWPPGYPLRETLAGTENLIGWQPFFMPARLLGVGVVAAYNICVLASFVVSGLVANLFARRCGVDRDGALIAGFVFAFAPIHVGLLVQIQSLAICWLPLGIVAFERVMTEPRVRNVVALVAMVVLSALGSLYYGVFLVLLLAVWYAAGLATGRFQLSRTAVLRLTAAVVLTLCLLYPFAIQYVRVGSAFGFDRSLEYAIARSMGIADFFQLQNWLFLWGESPIRQRDGYGAAFPGFVVLALLVASLRWKAAPRLKLILLAIAALCTVLSLGPRLKVFNYPTSYLANVPMPGAILGWIPGVRMPSRVLPCAFIFLSVLVGGGASTVIARYPGRRRLVVAGLVFIAALDAFPAPSFATKSWRVRAPLDSNDAYDYLARTPRREAVVELPYADSAGFSRPVQAAYVYGSVGHGQRVVAYDLSVRLPASDSLQAAAERLPDESARRLLVDRGVARLVVHRRFSKADTTTALLARLDSAGYPVLFRGRDATVYSLTRGTPTPVQP